MLYKMRVLQMTAAICISACTATAPEPLMAANALVANKVKLTENSINHAAFQLSYGNDPELERAFSQFITTGKAPRIVTDGFEQIAFNPRQQPIIETKPNAQTVISLEPGERFSQVNCGDPSKWTYMATLSGSGEKQQTHLLIQPLYPEISTTLTIATDRRLYKLGLVSQESNDAMRHVSFWYPDDMINTWNTSENLTPLATIQLDQLNFDYRMSSGWSTPSWKPLRIFDDGKKTFIEFPANMANRDMPLLFTVESSQRNLVNYRSQANYFVVDRIFKQAVLVMGVGRKQTQVKIINNHYS